MKPIAISFTLSLAAAAVVCFFTKCWAWLALYWLGFAAACSVLLWFVLWVISLFVRKRVYSQPSRFYQWLLNLGYAYICEGARLKVKASGLEKLPDEPFLLVSNHLSNLDNMVQCLALKNRSVAFIAKEELFKIPIVKGYITRCCYISIDRKSSKGGKSAVEQAEDYIRRGVCSIGVYPEGHRSRDGKVGKFHAGSFRTAIQTQCPIVVCAIIGTDKAKHRMPFRNTKVWFDVIDVVSPVGRKSTELAQDIQTMISDYISDTEEELK